MEQDPQQIYDAKDSSDQMSYGRGESPERLLPNASSQKLESMSGSKTFEQLVHEALEEELKYERDPALRNQANKRADEILAEFNEVRNQQNSNGSNSSKAKDSESDDSNKLSTELAKQLGIKQDKSASSKPVYPGTNFNLGTLDLIMAIVIAVLFFIVILLLIF